MTDLAAMSIAFVAGAAYEFTCAVWVSNVGDRRPVKAGLLSMVVASCEVSGLLEAIAHQVAAPCFVIGYGLGGFLGVTFVRRRAR